MQVTSYGYRRCPVGPLTLSLKAMVTWTAPVCPATTCSSLRSSCCRWRSLTVCTKESIYCVYLIFLIFYFFSHNFSSNIFLFHRVLSTLILTLVITSPPFFLALSCLSCLYLNVLPTPTFSSPFLSFFCLYSLRLLICRSSFLSLSMYPLNW